MTGMSQVQLDRYTSSSYTTVSGTASNGGLIRLTVASTSAFTTGNKAYIWDVGGTTEANGFWTVTVINSTTLDLQSSTYTNAYTSGGRVQTAGTWTKPSWAQYIRLVLIGGGGSGAGGSGNILASSCIGSGGGGGGALIDLTLSASQFNNTENYTVAATTKGGTAANAPGVVGVSGGDGLTGNITTFTVNAIGTLIAYAGGGGTASAGANNNGGGGAGWSGSGLTGNPPGNVSAGLNNGAQGGFGANVPAAASNFSTGGGGGGSTGFPNSGGPGYPGGNALTGGGGGGGAGGKNTTNPNVVYDGAAGGASRNFIGGAGGTVAGTLNGTNGTNAVGMQCGSGGGGAASSVTAGIKAGDGGNGGIPGGGGGGAGSFLAAVNTGGNGGDGARGEIWVISYEVDPSSTVGFGSFFG